MKTINVSEEVKLDFTNLKLRESAKRNESLSEDDFTKILLKKFKEVKNA